MSLSVSAFPFLGSCKSAVDLWINTTGTTSIPQHAGSHMHSYPSIQFLRVRREACPSVLNKFMATNT